MISVRIAATKSEPGSRPVFSASFSCCPWCFGIPAGCDHCQGTESPTFYGSEGRAAALAFCRHLLATGSSDRAVRDAIRKADQDLDDASEVSC